MRRAFVQFGARFLGWFHTQADQQLGLAKLAERMGFDYCWFPHDTFMRNSWVLTSALALVTSRVKIASVGSNPYTCDPSEIATYVSTLDEISQGRAELGLGMHTTDMVSWVGVKPKDPVGRTREAVALIRRLLKSDEKKAARFQGEHFRWSGQAYLRYRPIRKEIPIHIAAFGRSYLELSGEIGDGSLPMITPPESAPNMAKTIWKGCRKAGRPRKDVKITGFAWISISKHDPLKAREALKPIIAYFGPYLEQDALQTVGLSVRDFAPIRREVERGRYDLARELVTEEMLQLGITGSVPECIERIAKVEAGGLSQISLGGPLGPDPAEALRVIGTEILPTLGEKR